MTGRAPAWGEPATSSAAMLPAQPMPVLMVNGEEQEAPQARPLPPKQRVQATQVKLKEQVCTVSPCDSPTISVRYALRTTQLLILRLQELASIKKSEQKVLTDLEYSLRTRNSGGQVKIMDLRNAIEESRMLLENLTIEESDIRREISLLRNPVE